MKKEHFEGGMRVIERCLNGPGGKYWLCFGSLLNLVRDKSTKPMDDIDVGVFHKDFKKLNLENSFNKWEYRLKKKIVDDLTGHTLYYSFKHDELPPVDVFLWYEHNNIFYHTYDVHQEKRRKPSEYVFKGVPAEHFPKPQTHPVKDNKIMRTFFGAPRDAMFNFEIQVPTDMGYLFDLWYPNWLVKREMQSMSPYVVKMKSCKMWHDLNYVNEQLNKSKEEYKTARDRMMRG